MSDVCAPKQVADYLLVESLEYGEVLTNLKLQKLLYYAQAWFLAINGNPLFEEDFQAWVHGPVLRSQYNRFKRFQGYPITTKVNSPRNITSMVQRHLEKILKVFGSETAIALELMAHRERPWLEARGNLPIDASSEAIIKKDTMRDFYRSL